MIEVRNAIESDADPIAKISIKAWERAVASWGEDVDKIREHVYGSIDEGSRGFWNTVLVAVIEDVVVGYGGREELDFRVSYLCVDPDHEHKGVGSALLAALERDIESEGFEYVEVSAHARSKQVISLYQRHGYYVVGSELKYSTTLVQDVEKVTMRKDLKCVVESDAATAPSELQ